MNIAESQENDFTVLTLDGEIDLNNSMDLKSEFEKLLSGSHSKVIIDLSAVSFIDSSGIATLVEFMQNIGDKDGQLYLVGVSEKIMGIFEITKLDKVFSIHSSKDEVFSL